MPDPRKNPKYEEIKVTEVTYKYDNTITYDASKPGGSEVVGRALTITGDDTVGLVADGGVIRGRLERVYDDGLCSVRIAGFMKLPAGTGATLTRGSGVIGAARGTELGYVKAAATPYAGFGFIQNSSDPDAVGVMAP